MEPQYYIHFTTYHHRNPEIRFRWFNTCTHAFMNEYGSLLLFFAVVRIFADGGILRGTASSLVCCVSLFFFFFCDSSQTTGISVVKVALKSQNPRYEGFPPKRRIYPKARPSR
ncbi:hypothetical protein GGS26DRAFT_258546 [Hypomontagnella submonticulosa]|nr:hypothetical protein GGS26DRAFT_258546 [Hypomontagnella submonticulosa]